MEAKELLTKFAVGGWGKEHSSTCVDEIIEAITWHELDVPNK